ncbi:MAG TPA: hypothetical protein VG407_02830 [Caulobacteraceae bacterium]|jgi:hypothetical protein|nr:hypothetical protein [Caulobacteraceae bacterium]
MAMLGYLSALPLPLLILLGGAILICCVHAVRTHQNYYWIWIILMVPGFGAAAYFLLILLPEWSGTGSARRLGQAAANTLDPGRDYRRAKTDYDDAPTVQNAMKLAEAACGMGRWEEAEKLYGGAAQGFYADDPALLLGRARAQLELNRPQDALGQIEHLAKLPGLMPPQGELLRGRALQALGRMGEAEKAYKAAYDRLPGLEPVARYAAFLAEVGRKDEAQTLLKDIQARAAKTRGPFRKEAAAWRDYAQQKIGD